MSAGRADSNKEESELLSELERKLHTLQGSFDEGFARPQQAAAAPGEERLLIRVAGRAYALELRELSGLSRARRIVPLPAAAPGLLGLCGLRGALVPVFSLAALLGLPAGGPPAWLALADAGGADHAPLALAFEGFEGQQRLGPGQPGKTFEGEARPILSVPGLLETIYVRGRERDAARER